MNGAYVSIVASGLTAAGWDGADIAMMLVSKKHTESAKSQVLRF